jgi:hypothetical protein
MAKHNPYTIYSPIKSKIVSGLRASNMRETMSDIWQVVQLANQIILHPNDGPKLSELFIKRGQYDDTVIARVYESNDEVHMDWRDERVFNLYLLRERIELGDDD